MFQRLFILCIILFFVQQASGQVLEGTVSDRTTQVKLDQVEVYNQQTKQKTLTNAKGEFSIRASVNNVIISTRVGYKPDTLFLVDMKPVKRYMELNNTLLKTVNIKSGAFDPRTEYSDVYVKAKIVNIAQNEPLAISPSHIFGKEGRDARRFKRKLEREVSERKIDARFNEAAVTALTPLKGTELDYFMVLYRPKLKALDEMDDQDFKFYLMNSYKEFKALPPEKRISPPLH
ncbi:carboxypeptidase-like regulatory domain-containing protein [Pedobacter sp. L105]|uniref:carboxypeptidase-like regulatory domain-containing protein n=1 Tax=Pedobacter sp. L105 TaxID=1641871 RepID=UPI00131C0B18|nr:carboxypeptidase-like regulatory domain-containing protein [Pedobacter sp. L105]